MQVVGRCGVAINDPIFQRRACTATGLASSRPTRARAVKSLFRDGSRNAHLADDRSHAPNVPRGRRMRLREGEGAGQGRVHLRHRSPGQYWIGVTRVDA